MSARENLLDTVGFADAMNLGSEPEWLIDAYRTEVLNEAADWLTAKYGVTNRAAGDLRRLAEGGAS
ncbi:hypothetical protein [Streptomyces sp. CFMR 7]|uniref:hypothetical protein n=1 Tax=Streptomyces sp. CFMR 7 TaxID=1649184 RepID=UPI0011A4B73C|nr:hypothetical protein [Streptomyces sp. CFMR 7]